MIILKKAGLKAGCCCCNSNTFWKSWTGGAGRPPPDFQNLLLLQQQQHLAFRPAFFYITINITNWFKPSKKLPLHSHNCVFPPFFPTFFPSLFPSFSSFPPLVQVQYYYIQYKKLSIKKLSRARLRKAAQGQSKNCPEFPRKVFCARPRKVRCISYYRL